MIRPGDTVEVANPLAARPPIKGRAYICNFIRDPTNLTVALGRKNGHPLICTPENFIRIVT